MLHRLAILAAFVIVSLAAAGLHVHAARDERAPATASTVELVVFEVKNCHVCEYVHSHIQPAYDRSPNAQDAPMRFVDLNEVDERALGLVTPITTVPTIVLMHEGREVTRLVGYTGREIFFRALPEMMSRVR